MDKIETNKSEEISEKKVITSESNKSSISEEKINRKLEVIVSPSVRTKEIYKALTFIRTEIIEDSEGIKLLEKVGGCKPLLKILSHNNEDILNITVSILGNLCNYLIRNEDFQKEVIL